MRRKDVIHRIDAVYREHHCAKLAVARLHADAEQNNGVLAPANLRIVDVRACRDRLEATYFARMFAVFEAYLREVWEIAFERDTHPKAQDLLNGCAARQHVPYDIRNRAHSVRNYRNYVVHGSPAEYVTLELAKEWLCTFFGRMPAEW